MRILYVYPVPGELGWLLFNFLPHLQYQLRDLPKFDAAVVHSRYTYEGLYRTGVRTDMRTFDYHGDQTEGNAFVLHAPYAYDRYKEHCLACDGEVKQLEAGGNKVQVIRLPKKEYRYHRYKMRHRLFLPLPPLAEYKDKWSGDIEPDAVVFHLRSISRSIKKNTSKHLYQAAANWAKAKGRQFVTVGATLGYKTPFPILGLDLLNKTNLDDLLAIFNLGGMVVGSSSGPMHLASLTQTPHVVWGGGRSDIRTRYLKSWNPFDTPVAHLTTAFDFSDKKLLLDALGRIGRKSESDTARRTSHATQSN